MLLNRSLHRTTEIINGFFAHLRIPFTADDELVCEQLSRKKLAHSEENEQELNMFMINIINPFGITKFLKKLIKVF